MQPLWRGLPPAGPKPVIGRIAMPIIYTGARLLSQRRLCRFDCPFFDSNLCPHYFINEDRVDIAPAFPGDTQLQTIKVIISGTASILLPI